MLLKQRNRLKFYWNIIYIYIYIYIYIQIPKEPEVIYLGFTYRIIKIILTKEGWPKRHFIDKIVPRKNLKNSHIEKTSKNKKRHILFVKSPGFSLPTNINFFFYTVRIIESVKNKNKIYIHGYSREWQWWLTYNEIIYIYIYIHFRKTTNRSH